MSRFMAVRYAMLKLDGGIESVEFIQRDTGEPSLFAQRRGDRFVEPLRHLSHAVNGWRAPGAQHSRRIARGGRREPE